MQTHFTISLKTISYMKTVIVRIAANFIITCLTSVLVTKGMLLIEMINKIKIYNLFS